MTDYGLARITTFLADEYNAATMAADAGSVDQAWLHLERAHIVAQARWWPHCQSHWQMLRLAIALRDWRETGGQILRLALAPIGNLTGRLPLGNTGRASINAFARMKIPPDLQAILDPQSD